MSRLPLTLSLVIGAMLLQDGVGGQPPRAAPDPLVFEDFDSVEKWEGFELSGEQAKSGATSARWARMDRVPSVSCSDIPHDWRGYAHFTFWVYSEKDVGSRFMCIIRSENPATEGMDYWSLGVGLNFTGWRRFGLAIREGTGTRSPLGWDQVQGITFTATGWDNTPHPEAIVYIDELKLTNEFGGEGPIISDEELFGMLRDDILELAAARQAAAAGDYARAKVEYLTYARSPERPVWRFDWRDWDKSRRDDYDTGSADRVLRHVFSWFGREADLGPDIEWTSNGFDPTEPAYTPEWTYNLNRFGYWRTLAQAYWATGEEKYAREYFAQVLDWIADQPPPVLGHPNTGPCWRTIEQGIRMSGSWMDAYHHFLGSPLMTPEAHATIVKSFVEHAQQLTRMTVEHPEHGGNWVTMECNGLAHVGVMFPEFAEAQRWRDVAYGRLLMELDRQVYPDGAQMELTTGYHQVALRNFRQALDPALRNDVEVPAEYQEKLERMYRYNLYAMMPTGHLPP
ncbi:MAG: heparinase II/III family protein, partial [Armatimonadota bacterium]